MPWNSVIPMEQRLRFVLLVQDDLQTFSEACRLCDISRKTGYKWWERYNLDGLKGLEERSHRPFQSPMETPIAWTKKVVFLRQKHPHWGPKKIRARLLGTSKKTGVPASSTIGRILASLGLVKAGRKRRRAGPVVTRPGLTAPLSPNHVWAVDFKGWFSLGNGERCEPLTVTDLFSRYLLCCSGGSDVSYAQARPVFEKLFKEYGQPSNIRVDNGPPFGSTGAAGLSRLAAWWVSLGITPEFIDPGHPEQNGSHERMHRTLKAEALKPIAHYRQRQQKQFDRWRREFNHKRPHEALGQVPPANIYRKSSVVYHGSHEPIYPSNYVLRQVRTNGQIRWSGQKRFVGEAFIGQTLGIEKKADGTLLIYFYNYLLGEIEENDEKGIKPVVCVRARVGPKTGQCTPDGALE